MELASLKDEWKFATIMNGALSVMTHGLLRMPMWPVDNLDSVIQVTIAIVKDCDKALFTCRA